MKIKKYTFYLAILFFISNFAWGQSTEDTVYQAVSTVEDITESTETALDSVKELTDDMVSFKTDIERILTEWEEAERQYGSGNVPEGLKKNLTLKVRLAASNLNKEMFSKKDQYLGSINKLKTDVYQGVDLLEGIVEKIDNSPIRDKFDDMVRQKEAYEAEIDALIAEQKECATDACKENIQIKIDNYFNMIDQIIDQYSTSKEAYQTMSEFKDIMAVNTDVMRKHFIPASDRFYSSLVKMFYKFSQISTGSWSKDTFVASANFRNTVIAFAKLVTAMNQSTKSLDQVSKMMREENIRELSNFQREITKIPNVANSRVGDTNEQRLEKYKKLKLNR